MIFCRVRNTRRDHSFSTYAKFSGKNKISFPLAFIRKCAYQGVRNFSFPENFAYTQNEWSSLVLIFYFLFFLHGCLRNKAVFALHFLVFFFSRRYIFLRKSWNSHLCMISAVQVINIIIGEIWPCKKQKWTCVFGVKWIGCKSVFDFVNMLIQIFRPEPNLFFKVT